jgi:small-conductance mechanosensitive channel
MHTRRIAFLICLGFMALPLLSCAALAGVDPAGPPALTPLPDATRTPLPTSTPGPLSRGVERLSADAGLAGTSFLGLPAAGWLNLLISVIIVVAGALVVTFVVRSLLPSVVCRTPAEWDDQLLESIRRELWWLVVVATLWFATDRLTFLSAGFKATLGDIYFTVLLGIVLIAAWKVIGLLAAFSRERAVQQGREGDFDLVIVLSTRVARIVVLLVGLTVLLSRFDVNVTLPTAILILGGFVVALAARGSIADAIAGFIILVDRPFRTGDRIEIQGVNTWGDVTEIGLRTTRIRTRDNRLVIVPNSTIGDSQVINYSFPDPRMRVQTHVKVAYGSDIQLVRRTIVDAIYGVPGVLPDEPVDALYIEMGDFAMVFRVRWWILSYADARPMLDSAHEALQEALDSAGISMPYPTQTLKLEAGPGPAEGE